MHVHTGTSAGVWSREGDSWPSVSGPTYCVVFGNSPCHTSFLKWMCPYLRALLCCVCAAAERTEGPGVKGKVR